MSYTYFPKNGTQVNLFGIPVGRSGREFPFPVKDYETGVQIGVLVRTPEEMDNYRPVSSTIVEADDDSVEEINSQAEAELLKALAAQQVKEEVETYEVTKAPEEVVKPLEDKAIKSEEVKSLTKEEAFKYIKMEADGTYAKHADGTYKIKGGWKPYTKEEIYKAIAEG